MKISLNTVGTLLALLVVGSLVLNTVKNPLAAQGAWLQTELASLSPEWAAAGESSVNLDELRAVISSRGDLWQRLIAPPPPPPVVINVLEKLQGVQVTRQTMGTGKELRIKLITPSEPRGKWFGIGDQINGATLREINDNQVVFAVGEFTGALSR